MQYSSMKANREYFRQVLRGFLTLCALSRGYDMTTVTFKTIDQLKNLGIECLTELPKLSLWEKISTFFYM
jgi:hypothetical protein